MKEGPVIASIAALIGDPARANMLSALMDGRALTVSELAEAAGVAMPTASGHLSRLAGAGMVTAVRQGRHCYYRLSGSDVAQAIEALMGLAERTGGKRARPGPRDPALREARICYDHLAGSRAVALMQGLETRGWILGEEPRLTEAGHAGLTAAGIDVSALARGRRPLCLGCLDWSERRSHLGGALGAAILSHLLARGWAKRDEGRLVRFDAAGAAAFAEFAGLQKPNDEALAAR